MADYFGEALGKVLDEFDERRRADLAREQKVRDDDALFLAQFAELRRDVVRPVFEAAGKILAERGHKFSITEENFGVDGGSRVSEAGISIHIAPTGLDAQLHAEDHARSLSFTTRHYNKTVWINAGKSLDSGGTAGSKGAHPLERITRQFVEEAVLKFVAGVVG
jgi:hypothetical protein